MKKIISALILSGCTFVSQISHAEWQMVNHDDKKAGFAMYIDFHGVKKINNGILKVPTRTGYLSKSALSNLPENLSDVYITANVLVSCKDKSIADVDKTLHAKAMVKGKSVDVVKKVGSNKDAKAKPLTESNVVDMTLYNRLCR